MDKVKEYVKNKRESLSGSSITTYSSILKNLFQKVFGKEKEIDLDMFDNHIDETLKFLKDIPANKRKTILSALVIITDKKPYRDLMLSDVREYNADINKQEKTPSQQESWIDTSQVKDIYNELKKTADLLYKKKQITPADLQEIQNFIILSVSSGLLIPPRRSLDYCDFKIKNIDKEKNNYMEKNKFIFNTYKTAKTYGRQEVDIPVQLKNIITKWIKVNPTEYLLFDSNMNPLSSVKINQRFNRIFGNRKISVNQMRHTYLTDKFGTHSEQQNKLDKAMTEMGSSSNMEKTYIKLD